MIFDIGGDIGFYRDTRAFSVFAGVTFVPNGRGRLPIVRKSTPSTGNAVAVSMR